MGKKYNRNTKGEKTIRELAKRVTPAALAVYYMFATGLIIKGVVDSAHVYDIGGISTSVSDNDAKIISDGISFYGDISKENMKKISKTALDEVLLNKSYSNEAKEYLKQALDVYIENNYEKPALYEFDLETSRLNKIERLEENIKYFLKAVALTDKIVLVDPNSDSIVDKYYMEELRKHDAVGLSYFTSNIIVVSLSNPERILEIIVHEEKHRETQYAKFPDSVEDVFDDPEIISLYGEVKYEFRKQFLEGIATREGNKALAQVDSEDLYGETIEDPNTNDIYAYFKTERVYGFYYTMYKNYEYLLGQDFFEDWMQDGKYNENVIQEMKNIVDEKYGEGTFDRVKKFSNKNYQLPF